MSTSIRSAESRGYENHGWLDSFHSFSFADYYDPKHMGFGSLRVINEDRVQPGAGFGTHSHSDMEIISYVLDGALEHKDSLGTGSIIRPGDVQRMSAGSGIRHSEFNHSKTEPVHFLQIWIIPERKGLKPDFEQKAFSLDAKQGKLCLIGSRNGRDGSVTIHQDVKLYNALLKAGEGVLHELALSHHAWVQVVKGEVDLNGTTLKASDGAAISDETLLKIRASKDAEILLFDLK